MEKDSDILKAVIEEKIRKIQGAMAQEDLNLDVGTLQMLSECLKGNMSFEEARTITLKKFSSGKSDKK